MLRDARVVIEIAGTIGLLFIHRNVIPVVDAIFKKDGLVVFEPMAFGDELGLIDEGRNTGRTALKAVRDLGGEHVVIGTYGTFLLALACQMGAVTPEVTCTAVMPAFSEDEPLYLSPVRSGVAGASHALRETMFSLQAAPALSTPSRPLRADELLPERALLGDDYAREELYRNVYQVLRGENPDDPTYLTVSTFLKYGSSLENTAKELNVHPNTVRYRLKRAAETTGWDATDPRDAYVLTTALAIGRMRDR